MMIEGFSIMYVIRTLLIRAWLFLLTSTNILEPLIVELLNESVYSATPAGRSIVNPDRNTRLTLLASHVYLNAPTTLVFVC